MSQAECWTFLEHPVRAATVSTVRADGRPHLAPVWIAVEDGAVIFNTGADTIKGRNLARQPALSICVQDDQPPFAFVVIEGMAQLIDDLGEVLRTATVIGGRYMGQDRAHEYGVRNGVPGEYLVKVTPERIFGMTNLADPGPSDS